jgi:hypothetical protein
MPSPLAACRHRRRRGAPAARSRPAALGDDEGPRHHRRRRRRSAPLRDQISEARAEDLPPLIEQMTRLAALRGRLGGSRSLPIDLQSPYFAHIRLKEGGKRRDVMIGKRGFIDRTSNVQIVDWRNAPVSRIYYRYEEGDDYEEEFAGKSLDGVVEARRNVSIHKGALRRIGAPQGTYIKDARGAWQQAVGTMQPVLHGGVGKAARPVIATGGQKGKLGVHHGQAIRADKALPEIAALIDKDSSSSRSPSGLASSRAAPARARPPSRCTGWRTSTSPTAAGSGPTACCSWCRRPRWSATSPACCRPWAWPACQS